MNEQVGSRTVVCTRRSRRTTTRAPLVQKPWCATQRDRWGILHFTRPLHLSWHHIIHCTQLQCP